MVVKAGKCYLVEVAMEGNDDSPAQFIVYISALGSGGIAGEGHQGEVMHYNQAAKDHNWHRNQHIAVIYADEFICEAPGLVITTLPERTHGDPN
jgi:hypothetical protein